MGHVSPSPGNGVSKGPLLTTSVRDGCPAVGSRPTDGQGYVRPPDRRRRASSRSLAVRRCRVFLARRGVGTARDLQPEAMTLLEAVRRRPQLDPQMERTVGLGLWMAGGRRAAGRRKMFIDRPDGSTSQSLAKKSAW